jgi:hypothetical protein
MLFGFTNIGNASPTGSSSNGDATDANNNDATILYRLVPPKRPERSTAPTT